jgi:hypothetical protein
MGVLGQAAGDRPLGDVAPAGIDDVPDSAGNASGAPAPSRGSAGRCRFTRPKLAGMRSPPSFGYGPQNGRRAGRRCRKAGQAPPRAVEPFTASGSSARCLLLAAGQLVLGNTSGRSSQRPSSGQRTLSTGGSEHSERDAERGRGEIEEPRATPRFLPSAPGRGGCSYALGLGRGRDVMRDVSGEGRTA